MKIAVIGAGSYVFGPSVLMDAIGLHRLGTKDRPLELALFDVNPAAGTLMAGVARVIAMDVGVQPSITATTDRAAALRGADFVICCAAVQMRQCFEVDVAIIRETYPRHLVTEFGGVQGISYSLRQIAMIEDLASDMRKLCPGAWLLNIANPLSRVTQAAHEAGIKTAGFCSASQGVLDTLHQIFTGEPCSFPWEAAKARFETLLAGTNHLTWLLELRDKATGADLFPQLRQLASQGDPRAAMLAKSRSGRLMAHTGFLPTAGDDHIKDFLAPEPGVASLDETSHGCASERQARLDLLHAIATGQVNWRELIPHRAWERPVDFAIAVAWGQATRFDSLNLINDAKQVPALPAEVFVETPAVVGTNGAVAQKVDLPASVAPFCQSAAAVTLAIVQAARGRSLKGLQLAVELDPTILDKARGWQALARCLEAHAKMLPEYV